MSGGDLLPLLLVMQISQMQMRQKPNNFFCKQIVIPDVYIEKNIHSFFKK